MKLSREEQWQKVFDELKVHLQTFGVEGIYPPSDFMLVEDDWGGYQQKICILNAQILTQAFVRELQKFLGLNASEWEVVIAMSVPEKDFSDDGMGLKVTSTRVKYDWDLDEVRKILGDLSFFR